MEFKHISVLPEEAIQYLINKKDGIYVDATLGGAGHFCSIAKHLDNTATLIGIDQDSEAIANARKVTADLQCNCILVNDNFKNIDSILNSLNIDKIDGILFDLGVSSYQLDNPERGFSYNNNADLDMRMNQNTKLTAKKIVNEYSKDRLSEIIFKYGEERWAKRIAEFIVNERKDGVIETTFELVGIIKKAIPKSARQDGPHPAKRTFQAIRIEVNNELNILADTFETSVKYLSVDSKIVVISFHSLEDRIVKQTFARLQKGCECPPHVPICLCGKKALLKKVVAQKPSDKEIVENHRSRSAYLRVSKRI